LLFNLYLNVSNLHSALVTPLLKVPWLSEASPGAAADRPTIIAAALSAVSSAALGFLQSRDPSFAIWVINQAKLGLKATGHVC